MYRFQAVSSRLSGLLVSLTLVACGGPSGEESPVDALPTSSTAKALDRGEAAPVDPPTARQVREAIDLRANPGSEGMERSFAAMSYSASYTYSATTNTANLYFNLAAGETITLGTCGVNGASGSGDTYLRFYGPNGAQVAYSDDGCGVLSNFTYAVPVTGTYLLRSGCFGNGACSGTVAYRLQ
jgi:hypothetical protein